MSCFQSLIVNHHFNFFFNLDISRKPLYEQLHAANSLKGTFRTAHNPEDRNKHKREAGNPILNILSKATSAIFSVCKRQTGTCLQSWLCINHSNFVLCKPIL